MSDIDPTGLHAESIVVDGLNASWFLDPRVLERLHRGGVTAVNATIAAWHSPEETMTLIARLQGLLRARSDIAMPVASVAGIHAAKATGRVGVIMGFQDTAPLADDLGLLARYHALGVRVIQLTYNHANRVGSGCLEPEDRGLTAYGREVIREMNRLGVLVDVSHCGPRTTLEAVAASQQPIAITHANAKTFCDQARNKSDEAIRAIAKAGGVIGAVAFGALLAQGRPATLDDYVAAIDYLVDLAGIDHVGLGPDFMEEMPQEVAAQALKGLPAEAVRQFSAMPPTHGFASAAEFPNVTAALLASRPSAGGSSRPGYLPADVRKIIGGNWLRLYGAVWK